MVAVCTQLDVDRGLTLFEDNGIGLAVPGYLVAEILCDLADRNHRYAVCNAAFGQLRAILRENEETAVLLTRDDNAVGSGLCRVRRSSDVEPREEAGADMDVVRGYNVAGHERLNARVLRDGKVQRAALAGNGDRAVVVLLNSLSSEQRCRSVLVGEIGQDSIGGSLCRERHGDSLVVVHVNVLTCLEGRQISRSSGLGVHDDRIFGVQYELVAVCGLNSQIAVLIADNGRQLGHRCNGQRRERIGSGLRQRRAARSVQMRDIDCASSRKCAHHHHCSGQYAAHRSLHHSVLSSCVMFLSC